MIDVEELDNDTVTEPEIVTDETEAEEVVVSIGEEPEQVEEQAPGWVNELRKQNREMKRQLKEREQATQTNRVKLGPRPKLEDFAYDTAQYDVATDAWHDQKRSADAEAAIAKNSQDAAQKDWQSRQAFYTESKAALKYADVDEAEDVVRDALSVTQQGMIMQGADNPGLLVYALGTSPAKLRELAAIKDPVKFAFKVAKMETQVTTSPRKPTAVPDKTPIGNSSPSASGNGNLEKLRETAEKSGDYTAYFSEKRRIGT